MGKGWKFFIWLLTLLGLILSVIWVYHNFKSHIDKRIVEAKAVVKTYYS